MNGEKEIIETLCGWGQRSIINLKDDLLLAKGRNGLTAWDIAAEKDIKDILEELWGWCREVQVSLKDDLLLSKGYGLGRSGRERQQRDFREIVVLG